ncbi:MAG: hypothetical protein WC891_08655 [Actinomycetota bacterium]
MMDPSAGNDDFKWRELTDEEEAEAKELSRRIREAFHEELNTKFQKDQAHKERKL